MSAVADRIDPALARLLDELPREDPDGEWAYVSLAYCEGEHRVPMYEPVTVNFGTWHGPMMLTESILIHVRGDGWSEDTTLDGPYNAAWVHPGDEIVMTLIVERP